MLFFPDGLTCLLMALAAVPTFTLLGSAVMRMRAHDRLTLIVWWLCGTLAVGAGLWATWVWALVSPRGVGAGALAAGCSRTWLAALAGCGMAGAGVILALARTAWPETTRRTAQSLVACAWWTSLFACAWRSLPDPRPAFVPAGALRALAIAPTAVALSMFFALSLMGAERFRALRHATLRTWLSGAIVGTGHAGAAWLALTSLGAGAWAPAPVPDRFVGPGTLQFACAVALLLVAIGLACAWLDLHAHRRNRLLAASLHEANQRLREQAMSDPLTRMPNRLMFEERLADALAVSRDAPRSLAVLFIDLDGFKPVNDSFGHVAGDAVLREVGRRLKALSHESDLVARIGGDEFLFMIRSPGNEAMAAAAAQGVLRTLGEPLTLPNGVPVNLSASIGIVMYPEHGPASKLIANADAAMYAAKRAGGSTYAFFEPRMELDAREQLALQNELRLALERNELQLYYQPKIDSRSSQITGVESLLRWQHAVRGFVPPDRFIPIAERFGLIGAIGNWVIEEACRQLGEWQQLGLRMRVSVNLSVHQLRQEDLVPRIRAAVERHGIDAQLLTFEITETVAMEDTQETLRAFSQLASVGVSLSIDDFGTGYSSLSYLRKLPARQLKIDRSFVQDLGQNQDALAVVDAVIRLAHALGLRVVAEGVETPRQRDILLELRCDEFQGYLFAKPMAAHMLMMWAQGSDLPPMQGPAMRAVGRADFRPSLFAECDMEFEDSP